MHRFLPLLVIFCACSVGELAEPTDPATPAPAGELTAFVFAHGFASRAADAFDDEIIAALEADGRTVYRTNVPSIEGLAVRGPAFADELDRVLADSGADRVHIIAHSMGGLDARYAISKLGYGDRVASLTTMSTPHRGSLIADYSLGLIGTEDDAVSAFDAFISLVGDVDPDALRRNLEDLSVARADAFNADAQDDPNVLYQSFSGLSSVWGIVYGDEGEACDSPGGTLALPDPTASSILLVAAAPFVGDGPADGVVPVSSARWGNFRGCLAVDHTTETGTIQAETSPLDMLSFYRELANQLAP